MRILQISDIHFKHQYQEMDDYKLLRTKFLEDLDRYYNTYKDDISKHVDYIMICGDIGQSGKPTEYENEATNFIKKLCQKIHCDKDNVFMIPGNHDEDRDCPSYNDYKNIIDEIRTSDNPDNALLNIADKHPKKLELIYKPYKAYYNFSSNYISAAGVPLRCLEQQEYNLDEHKMYWAKELRPIKSHKVNLYGFNSHILHGYMPKLCLYNNRLESDINICMMHHPSCDMINSHDIMEKIDAIFQIQMYGHTHKQNYSISPQNNAIRINTGALQPPISKNIEQEYYPLYNFVDLDVVNKEHKEKLIVCVHPNRWSYLNKDFEDDSTKTVCFNIDISKPNRWKKDINVTLQFPKRKIQYALFNEPGYIKIIQSIYPNFIILKNRKIDCDNFFKEIEKDKKYNILAKKLNLK